ncbi:hypothetical protein Fmac_012281 [Flemingia macrophylla]|uniref:Uncharacterized protein n=1 Tax=Flemingia macrophylla TaxID=520843 RepID=A0ABD1MRX4_9FABA
MGFCAGCSRYRKPGLIKKSLTDREIPIRPPLLSFPISLSLHLVGDFPPDTPFHLSTFVGSAPTSSPCLSSPTPSPSRTPSISKPPSRHPPSPPNSPKPSPTSSTPPLPLRSPLSRHPLSRHLLSHPLSRHLTLPEPPGPHTLRQSHLRQTLSRLHSRLLLNQGGKPPRVWKTLLRVIHSVNNSTVQQSTCPPLLDSSCDLSDLSLASSNTAASSSCSNQWQQKYTNLESQVQTTLGALKAYMIMKEGKIPDELAVFFDPQPQVRTF